VKGKLALALFVVVVALGAGFIAVLSSDDSPERSVSSASVPTVAATQVPPPTPLPIMALSVVWRDIAPAETWVADFGTMFLLDTETGKMYSPIEGTSEDGTRAGMEWAPDGGMSVWIHKPGTAPEPRNALFVGEALGAMKLVPGGDVPRVSSRRIAAVRHDGAYFLFDVDRQAQLGVLPLAPGQYPVSWSWDGRYLSIHRDGDSRKGENPSVSIWDTETRQVVLDVPAHQVSWANAHNRFLYSVVDVSRGDNSFVETRLSDLTTGEDYSVGSMNLAHWSTDDRYLVGEANAGDRINAFSVFDARDGKKLITARGTWPMAWVDEDTIGFMADVCTEAPSFFYVDADGSGLRKVIDDVGYGVVHPAPGGNKVAYTDYGDSPQQPNVVKVLTLSSNVLQEFDVGRTYLMPNSWLTSQTWSVDGRYLLLRAPVGKGGPCMGDEVVPFQLIRHP